MHTVKAGKDPEDLLALSLHFTAEIWKPGVYSLFQITDSIQRVQLSKQYPFYCTMLSALY